MVPAERSEAARVAALESYSILDTPPEVQFDDLVTLAAVVCGVDTALVSFVSANRQWAKANCGVDLKEMPREQSFCAHMIGSKQMLIVEDALQDERFRNYDLMERTGLRFYAGAPIIEKNGHVLGAVCVLDRQPHRLSEQQLRALQVIARQAVGLLEQRSLVTERGEIAAEMEFAHALAERYRLQLGLALEANRLGSWCYEPATDTVQCDGRARELFGLDRDKVGLEAWLGSVAEADRNRVAKEIAATLSGPLDTSSFEVMFASAKAPAEQRLCCRMRCHPGLDGKRALLGVVEPVGQSGA